MCTVAGIIAAWGISAIVVTFQKLSEVSPVLVPLLSITLCAAALGFSIGWLREDGAWRLALLRQMLRRKPSV